MEKVGHSQVSILSVSVRLDGYDPNDASSCLIKPCRRWHIPFDYVGGSLHRKPQNPKTPILSKSAVNTQIIN
jgi:hypothetical protein